MTTQSDYQQKTPQRKRLSTDNTSKKTTLKKHPKRLHLSPRLGHAVLHNAEIDRRERNHRGVLLQPLLERQQLRLLLRRPRIRRDNHLLLLLRTLPRRSHRRLLRRRDLNGTVQLQSRVHGTQRAWKTLSEQRTKHPLFRERERQGARPERSSFHRRRRR